MVGDFGLLEELYKASPDTVEDVSLTCNGEGVGLWGVLRPEVEFRLFVCWRRPIRSCPSLVPYLRGSEMSCPAVSAPAPIPNDIGQGEEVLELASWDHTSNGDVSPGSDSHGKDIAQ